MALNSLSLASQGLDLQACTTMPHIFCSLIRKMYVNFIQYMANSRFPGNSFEEMLLNLQWESKKVNNFIFHSKMTPVFLPIKVCR